MDQDERLMRMALDLAREAGRSGEVPVGAVVAVDGEVIGRGANAPIRTHDPTAHAEIVALREAGASTGNYRLDGGTLVCSVEPCLMCYGALLHARIARVVFGASDPKVGVTDRVGKLREGGAEFNHAFETRGGVLAAASSELLVEFFRARREDRNGEVPKWP